MFSARTGYRFLAISNALSSLDIAPSISSRPRAPPHSHNTFAIWAFLFSGSRHSKADSYALRQSVNRLASEKQFPRSLSSMGKCVKAKNYFRMYYFIFSQTEHLFLSSKIIFIAQLTSWNWMRNDLFKPTSRAEVLQWSIFPCYFEGFELIFSCSLDDQFPHAALMTNSPMQPWWPTPLCYLDDQLPHATLMTNYPMLPWWPTPPCSLDDQLPHATLMSNYPMLPSVRRRRRGGGRTAPSSTRWFLPILPTANLSTRKIVLEEIESCDGEDCERYTEVRGRKWKWSNRKFEILE